MCETKSGRIKLVQWGDKTARYQFYWSLTAAMHAWGGRHRRSSLYVYSLILLSVFSSTVWDFGSYTKHTQRSFMAYTKRFYSIHHTSLFFCVPWPKINLRQKSIKEQKCASAAYEIQREQWQRTLTDRTSYLSHQCLNTTICKHAKSVIM